MKGRVPMERAGSSAGQSGRADAPAGGEPAGGPFADLSGNPRVPALMQLVHSLSEADDPGLLLERFVATMREVAGPRSYVSLSTRGLPAGQYRIARWLSADGRELVRGSDPWRDHGLPVHSAGFFSRIVATPTPKFVPELEVDDDPILGNELARMGAMIAVPFFERGEPTVWTLLFHPEKGGFTDADLEAAILRTSLMGATASGIVSTRRLRAAATWIQTELDQIAEIQRSLLPQEEPDVPGLSFAAHYATFDRAGGDYYDLLPLRHLKDEPALPRYTEDLSSPWAILIADASGHGPSAAVLVAMLHTVLHSFRPAADGPVSPAALLEYLNRKLFTRRVGGGVSFVTAFAAIYDPVGRTLAYANAGHPRPLLRSADGDEVMPLAARSGTPLGIRDVVDAAEQLITLSPNQTLVMYTDGVVEAAAPDRRQFEIEGLIQAVLTGPMDDSGKLVSHLAAALRRHEAGERPRDDQTIVVLRAV